MDLNKEILNLSKEIQKLQSDLSDKVAQQEVLVSKEVVKNAATKLGELVKVLGEIKRGDLRGWGHRLKEIPDMVDTQIKRIENDQKSTKKSKKD